MFIFMNDSRKNLLLLRNYADFKLSFMNNANSNAINEDIGNEVNFHLFSFSKFLMILLKYIGSLLINLMNSVIG